MGTTIGAISTLISRPLPGKFTRARPTAVSVPSVVASRVAAGATMKEFFVARPQSSEVKRFWYHCSDQPGIG
jgi:hypothetical protein